MFYFYSEQIFSPRKASKLTNLDIQIKWNQILRISLASTAVSIGLGRVAKCKQKLKRKMLERPNYIFEKLGHSHVLIPFKSAPAHSTRPHNEKELFTSWFQGNSWKIFFSYCQQVSTGFGPQRYTEVHLEHPKHALKCHFPEWMKALQKCEFRSFGRVKLKFLC